MRGWIFLLFFWFAGISLAAQICDGNLGNNIFSEGDFGSGANNFLLVDPGIAPGYIYSTTPPPSDGFYTITNGTNQWNNIYGTWIRIGDNSADQNGYMMVVNADFTPGLFYENTISGLCDDTRFEFSADVINLIRSEVDNHILPNVSFLIDGQEFFSTGAIPQDEEWKTYGFTFFTNPGQSSITLSLRNNAPGGNGNDLALDNISFQACGPKAQILPEEIANICEDGNPIDLDATIDGSQFTNPFVQWQRSFDEGITWEDIPGETNLSYSHTELSAGFYYYRFLLAADITNLSNEYCRINSNIKIVQVVPKFYEIWDSICTNLDYMFGDTVLANTGIYTGQYISSLGCDSIVTLNLNIVADTEISPDLELTEPLCSYSEDGSIRLLSISNIYPPYVLTLNDIDHSEENYFPNLNAGNYSLKITDRYGCFFESDYQLFNPPLFFVELGGDQDVDLGDVVFINTMTSSTIDNFKWTAEDEINPEFLQTSFFPSHSQTVILNAISENGCVAVDSFEVRVDDSRKIYIPNAFSPNGDGTNDVFTIFGKYPNILNIKRFQIYNRWGGLIFEKKNILPNDFEGSWDGKNNGKLMSPGIYTYHLEVEFFDKTLKEYWGTVNLLR